MFPEHRCLASLPFPNTWDTDRRRRGHSKPKQETRRKQATHRTNKKTQTPPRHQGTDTQTQNKQKQGVKQTGTQQATNPDNTDRQNCNTTITKANDAFIVDRHVALEDVYHLGLHNKEKNHQNKSGDKEQGQDSRPREAADEPRQQALLSSCNK